MIGAWLLVLVQGAPSAPVGFDAEVRPFLAEHCMSCHGPTKPKGGLNLSKFSGDGALLADPRLWRSVAVKVAEGEMPPPERPAVPAAARKRFADRLLKGLEAADFALLPKDPGRKPIQRLTREEYNNTVRDLLGVTSRPADSFPNDAGGGKGFDNNAGTLTMPPLLLERYYDAAGQVLAAADGKRLPKAVPDPKIPGKMNPRPAIEEFGARAFRRPPEKPVVDRWVPLYERWVKAGKSSDDALRLVYRGMLSSPLFLYKTETDRPSREPWLVDDYEMASRLSYLLWSSMPDDVLFQLARERKLQDPAAVEEQARRMIADPRFRSMAESFATQWLQLRPLESGAGPDPGRYPAFTATLRDAMIDEAVEYFRALIVEDRSLLELIDSDYAYVNDELAKHYGIGGGGGRELRRTNLSDRRRGGVLGFGAVLAATSHPLRTSPVRRGKWVLEVLLGSPPSPPPPNIPSLPAEENAKQELSLRRQLEKHREQPACAACHARIDPVGFSLENFDPTGRWRDESSAGKLDTLGVLPTGEQVRSPLELKAVLSARKDEFVRNLTELMLSYALGRELQPPDQASVRQIVSASAAGGYRARAWLIEIVKSYPFRHRRP